MVGFHAVDHLAQIQAHHYPPTKKNIELDRTWWCKIYLQGLVRATCQGDFVNFSFKGFTLWTRWVLSTSPWLPWSALPRESRCESRCERRRLHRSWGVSLTAGKIMDINVFQPFYVCVFGFWLYIYNWNMIIYTINIYISYIVLYI